MRTKGNTTPIEERLMRRVVKTDSCWLWNGTTTTNGYGLIEPGEGSHEKRTHRVAWEIVAGPVPEGLFVLHTCDVRNCVRNDDEGTYELDGVPHERRGHLWLGTAADNVRDMFVKGRQSPLLGKHHTPRQHGEEQRDAKLTDEAVREIRQRYIPKVVTLRMLAEEYGVDISIIWEVVHRKAWLHVA
jgi:hypothetical protein